MNKDNGGPAFPRPCSSVETKNENELWNDSAKGMSLRDWFAGQALAGWISNGDVTGEPDAAAEYAYRCADAMLAERNK